MDARDQRRLELPVAQTRWSPHFGLGSATVVDVAVLFPSGATVVIPNVTAGQTLEVVEPN